MAPLPRSSIDGQVLTITEGMEDYVRQSVRNRHIDSTWHIAGVRLREEDDPRILSAQQGFVQGAQRTVFERLVQQNIRDFVANSGDAQGVINARLQVQRAAVSRARGLPPTDGINEGDGEQVRDAYIAELTPLVTGRVNDTITRRVHRDRAEALVAFEAANPAACRTYRVSCEEAIMTAPELDRDQPVERFPVSSSFVERELQRTAAGQPRPSVNFGCMMRAADMRLELVLSEYCRQRGMTAEQTNIFAGQVREGLQGPLRLRERAPTMPPILPPLPNPAGAQLGVIAEPAVEVPRLPQAVAARSEGRNTPPA